MDAAVRRPISSKDLLDSFGRCHKKINAVVHNAKGKSDNHSHLNLSIQGDTAHTKAQANAVLEFLVFSRYTSKSTIENPAHRQVKTAAGWSFAVNANSSGHPQE